MDHMEDQIWSFIYKKNKKGEIINLNNMGICIEI